MPPKKPAKKSAARKSAANNLRDKINVIALIEALERHVLGETEMTSTQVSAALALLKKTLPDMADPARLGLAPTEDSRHEDALKELE